MTFHIRRFFSNSAAAMAVAFACAPAFAVTCTSVATGNWNAPGTWSGCAGGNGPAANTPGSNDTAIIANGHAVTANVTIAAGIVTVNTGGTLNIANSNWTANGAIAISGTLTHTSTGGNAIFAGLVTVNSGGTWNNTINEAITFRGGITNNGTWNNGNATQTFDTNSQSIGGTNAIGFGGNVTISGAIRVTNNNTNTVTIIGALNGTVNGSAGSTWVNGANATLNYGSGTVPMNTGAFTANASGNTVNYNRAGNQTIKSPTTGGYYNLTLSTSGTKTLPGALTINNDFTLAGTAATTAAGALAVIGDFTIGSGTTFGASTFTHTVQGDFSNSGTFTAGASTISFTGSSSKVLGGTQATTFNNLTINKSGGSNITMFCGTPATTVNATLALTSGRIITSGTSASSCSTACSAQVAIIVGAAGTISGGSSASYVQGALRNDYPNNGSIGWLAAGFPEYPVGDATTYAPVEVISGTTTTAGGLTVCTTAIRNANIVDPPVSTQGIDSTKALNRYWSLVSSGLNTTAAPLRAKFSFASSDVPSGATATNFIVEKWNGAIWSPTTLASALANSTEASNIDITAAATYEIGIGEPLSGYTALPGNFNAFDTGTTTGAVTGVIQTKVSDTDFSVRLVRLNSTDKTLDTTYNRNGVTVELLDSSDNTGTLTASTACRPIGTGAGTWQVIPNTTQAVNFTNGVATATFTAAMLPNSYRDVRVHVVKTNPGAGEGCSTDRFTIRPTSLSITAFDTNWETAGIARALANTSVSGGTVHKASTTAATTSRPFTLRVSPQPTTATNYDGSPTAATGYPACGGPVAATLCTNAGALTLTAASWTSAGSGVRENATANYSEAGSFNLQLEDFGYASVDSTDGTPAATLTIPATATVQVGRFVPDHFAVAVNNTPQYRTFNVDDTSCTAGGAPRRTFTYMGQSFGWVTAPQVLIAAQNAANGTTTNYSGLLWHVTATDVTETYTSVPNTFVSTSSGTPTVTAGTDPANIGTGTSTSDANGTFSYPRTPAVQASFNANISLTVSVQDATENSANQGIINSPTPAVFNGTGSGIAFDGGDGGTSNGAEFRYGRLLIDNAYGSELLALPVRITAQYWDGAASAYVTNSADHCTSLASTNFTHSPGSGGAFATSIQSGSTLSSGMSPANGMIKLTKPTGFISKGSKVVTSAISYLPGSGRATFGIYKSGPVIYMREIY